MGQHYSVIKAEPFTFVDDGNRVINGFRVQVMLTEFQETHFVHVARLDPVLVKREVDALVQQRQQLAKL